MIPTMHDRMPLFVRWKFGLLRDAGDLISDDTGARLQVRSDLRTFIAELYPGGEQLRLLYSNFHWLECFKSGVARYVCLHFNQAFTYHHGYLNQQARHFRATL